MEIETFTMHLDFEHTFADDDATGGGRLQLHALDPSKERSLPVYNNSGMAGFEAGLEEISKIHPVVPISAQCEELESQGLDPRYASIALQLANNDHRYAARLVYMMAARRDAISNTATTEDSAQLEYETALSAESDAGADPVSELSSQDREKTGKGALTTPQKEKNPGSGMHSRNASGIPPSEDLSEYNSEDSNWEVVDSKCPVCSSDDPATADQVIPCCICTQQYHTVCAGLRRIPFGNKTEKEIENREKYVRKHFKDWKCSNCVACAADLADPSTATGRSRLNSIGSVDSEGPRSADGSAHFGGSSYLRTTSGRDDVSVTSSGIASAAGGHGHGHHRAHSAHTMSLPTSRQSYGVASGGGGIIITDAVRTPINPTGQPFTPNVPPGSATKPNLKVAVPKGAKGAPGSILFPVRSSTPDMHGSPQSSSKSSLSPVRTKSGDNLPSAAYFSPAIKSKNDQVASLMGLLATHGLNAEDLIGMSEEKQKETLVNLMSASNSLNSSAMGGAAAAKAQEVKQQDLASALKGLIARTNTSNAAAAAHQHQLRAAEAASRPAESQDTSEVETFDARKQMLEMIKRKTQQANPSPVPNSAAGGAGGATGFGFAGPGNGVGGAGGVGSAGNGFGGGAGGAYFPSQAGGGGGGGGNGSGFGGNGTGSVAGNGTGTGTGNGSGNGNGTGGGGTGGPGTGGSGTGNGTGSGDGSGPIIANSEFAKYFKMIKVGIPKHSIAEKLVGEGLVSSEKLAMELLSLDPAQRIPDKFFNMPSYDMDRLVPAGEHPSYKKFFKMLKLGLPRDAIKEKMRQEGLDSDVLDKSAEELIPQPKTAGGGGGGGGYGPGSGGGSPRGSGNGPGQSGGFGPGNGQGPGMGAGYGPGFGPGGGPGAGPGNGPGFGPGNGGGFGPGGGGGWGGPGGPGGMGGGMGSPGFGSPGGFGSPIPAKGGIKFVAAAEHPNYLKFFKMLKSGVPREEIRQQMIAAGLDASLLDREFSDQVPFGDADGANAAASSVKMVPAQDHPRYAQYFKMLKVGLPKAAVMLKMEQEGLDPNVILNAPETLIPLDVPPKNDSAKDVKKDEEEMVAIAEHPKYVKFFKMLKIGLPADAVKQKMTQEGLDPSMLDKPADEKIPLNDKKPEESVEKEEKVAVSEHPKYVKFFKMLKVGLPAQMVKSKMEQEGLDPSILDKDPAELIPLNDKPPAAEETGEKVPIGEHPKYAKFFKMLKVGLPPMVVKNKMTQEGLDPAMLDKPESELIPLNDTPAKEEGPKVPVSEHPKYAKFFKMLKVGLPPVAVKGKMTQEGVDPAMLDKDPSELIPLNDEPAKEEEGPMVPAGEHPSYEKYFKMLKAGVPAVAVRMKMQQEGLDPLVLEKDPTELIPLNPKAAGGPAAAKKVAAGPKVTKKKLHWKALDREKVKNSLWAEDDDEDNEDLHMDEEEFKRLFVQSESASAKKAEVKVVAKEVKKQKVSLINMKRAQNAGIALARIRFPYPTLREKIMDMDGEGLTTDQLKSLEEYLPSNEEEGQLMAYKGDVKDLGQAEQYMKVMLGFKSAPKRIRAMIFKQVYRTRINECAAKLTKIENACDDVKLSGRLKKVLKTILRVGNQLNDGEKHEGFTLDSLLKLQSAKAFDRKTSVLQYVITLISRNDADCLLFPEDLKHISEASRLTLDAVNTERKGLREEFDANYKIIDDIEAKEPTPKTGAMVDFLSRAEKMIVDLERGSEAVKKKFLGVLAYFGEDAGMSSTEFFTTLHKFVLEFVAVREVVERQRLSEQKRADAAEQQAHRASMASMPTGDQLLAKGGAAGKQSVAEKASRRRSTANIDPAAMSEFHRTRSAAMTKAQLAASGEATAEVASSSPAPAPVTPASKMPIPANIQTPEPSAIVSPRAADDGGSPAPAGETTPAKRIRLLQRRKSSIM